MPATAEQITLREPTPADAPALAQIVAEVDGRVVGSNFLDERDPIRGMKPMNVMALGEYHEPSGSWFPSVLY